VTTKQQPPTCTTKSPSPMALHRKPDSRESLTRPEPMAGIPSVQRRIPRLGSPHIKTRIASALSRRSRGGRRANHSPDTFRPAGLRQEWVSPTAAAGQGVRWRGPGGLTFKFRLRHGFKLFGAPAPKLQKTEGDGFMPARTCVRQLTDGT